MNSVTTYFTIFRALLARDVKVLKQRLLGMIIDALILMVIAILVFGQMLPLMGMPKSLIAPLFLGNSLSFFLASLGYNWSLRLAHDLKFDRFIDYFLTLPLPKEWLFCYYLTSFIMEATIITLPMITIGIIGLGDSFGPINGSFFIFVCHYFLVLLFWGLFFLGSVFIYSYQWFRGNMWARRIMPLFVFGTAFFTLKTISSIIPLSSKLMLLNPVTYIIEGLRSSLLGGPDYLAFPLCLLGTLCAIGGMYMRLQYGMYKTLDPV
jgi:ABC-type polysaccharide/polyol phosphate export permease